MIFACTKLTFGWTALYCLSVLLVQTGRSADAKRIMCQDGSYATIERAAGHMEKELRSWICPMNSTGQDVAVFVGIHDSKKFDLCPARCTIYCDKPLLEGGPELEDCNVLASYYAKSGRFTIEPRKGWHRKEHILSLWDSQWILQG
ncbi:hypothetical protein CPB84DRAFT_1745564 [Gymnopilus junonius]|uniref:Secreted protein n=1 Tax=Gymnopilus junonius TaxID=109634 RepID=A0A9P5NSL8_GYMJU|nr:hypothetical protein CPB84DRAFT_1745564 [Gymnopilus junonius]